MNLDGAVIASAVAHVRERRPLVQCIANVVAAEITANVLLASGAAPAMVIAAEEAPEFASTRTSALSINTGSLTAPALEAMRLTASAASASERRPPWVLDPVGCGGTAFRSEACRGLLELGPTVVRGNASEVMALSGSKGSTGPRGVDASDAAEAALPSAAELARKRGCVVVVTGPTDYVTDGAVTLALSGGEAMVQQVTGSGCALSALVVAFVACAAADGEGDGLGRLGYAAACCAFYKAAAARAGGDGCPGPGTLKVKLMDALAMDRDAVAAAVEASVSVKVVVTPGFQLSG